MKQHFKIAWIGMQDPQIRSKYRDHEMLFPVNDNKSQENKTTSTTATLDL